MWKRSSQRLEEIKTDRLDTAYGFNGKEPSYLPKTNRVLKVSLAMGFAELRRVPIIPKCCEEKKGIGDGVTP